MPFITHGPVLRTLPPDQIVLFLVALAVVVAVGTGLAYARCRRRECEFERILRLVLRRG